MIRYVSDSSSSLYGCGFLIHQVFQVFEDYAKLDKVLAAFYEGVRMFRKLLMIPLFLEFLKLFFVSQMGYSCWICLSS